jgi:hypothetical protein
LALIIVLLLLVLVLAVLLVVPRPGSTRSRRSRTADIDEDELFEAEEELRDLDITTTPEEASEEIPDWGPGAPKLRKDPDTGRD